MTSTLAVTGRGAGGATRRAAAVLLLGAWGVAVMASYLGDPAHELAPKLVTAFLLWRIWRGATWSRNLHRPASQARNTVRCTVPTV